MHKIHVRCYQSRQNAIGDSVAFLYAALQISIIIVVFIITKIYHTQFYISDTSAEFH